MDERMRFVIAANKSRKSILTLRRRTALPAERRVTRAHNCYPGAPPLRTILNRGRYSFRYSEPVSASTGG